MKKSWQGLEGLIVKCHHRLWHVLGFSSHALTGRWPWIFVLSQASHVGFLQEWSAVRQHVEILTL